MSSDSALEHSPTNGIKRRRTCPADTDAPAAKKSFTDAEFAAEVAHSLHIQEQRRAEVRAIYLNYGTLLKGSESRSEALAFQGLLDCASGSLGARRLAARLVPRFLPRFPSHAEQAFRLLSDLYGYGHPLHGDRGCRNGKVGVASPTYPVRRTAPDGADDCTDLEEAMRRDALLGLGNVLEAAVRQAERNVPVVMELVLFLMRHDLVRSVPSRQGNSVGSKKSASGDTWRGMQLVNPRMHPARLGTRARHTRRLCSVSSSGAVRSSGLAPGATTGAAIAIVSLTCNATQPVQPVPQQPLETHPDQSSARQGHGLKHRYNRRAAEAAANAEANFGVAARATNVSRGHSDDEGGGGNRRPQPAPAAAAQAAFDQGACSSWVEGVHAWGKGGTSGGGGHEVKEGGRAGTGAFCADLHTMSDSDSEAGVIRSLLARAFCLFPRVVLAACFQPFRLPLMQRGLEDCQACEMMLELLVRPSPAARDEHLFGISYAVEPAEAGSAQVGGGSLAAGGADNSKGRAGANDISAAGCASGPGFGSADQAADNNGCLAARVLAQLPETQTWLRHLANAMAQGKTQHELPKAVQVLLNHLLQYCSATVVHAPVSAAAACKVSPRASPIAVAAPSMGPVAPHGGPSANPIPTRQGASKPDTSGAAATAAQSVVASDDNSRSVPMDLDQSISTTMGPEGSGAGTAATGAGAAGAAAAAALAWPPDTAATPAPQPLPQPFPYTQHDAAFTLGPQMVTTLPPSLLPFPSYSSSGSSGLRGGPVCRAEACLYIGGLPPGLTEGALVSDLCRLGAVESVHPFDQQQLILQQQHAHGAPGSMGGPQSPVGEEVYVVFASLRDAAICYESVARTCRFGDTRPLVVEFCSAFPADSPAARRCVAAASASGGSSSASEFVWVSSLSGVTPEVVVAVLQAAALPVPQQILQVAGRAPGMLLHMSSVAIVPQVTACLQAHFMPLPPQAAAAGGASAAGSSAGATALLPPPPPLTAQGTPPSGLGVPYTTPLHMQQTGGNGGPVNDPPPPGCRTIWIGQLHDNVRDEDLLSVCRRHGGDVVGHRILRGSHCAFVDFSSQAGAEAAKRVLHGTRLGQQHIRVEWKLDAGPPPRPPLTQRHGGALMSSAPSTPIGGVYGMGCTASVIPVTPACQQGLGLPQQVSVPTAGLSLQGKQLTPQAVAAANVAAAAAAAAARGTFPGARTGADRWAPVVIPPAPVPTAPAAVVTTGQMTPSAVGFLGAGQLSLQASQSQPLGTYTAGAMNPAVAAAARQAAPMILAHQQMVAAGLNTCSLVRQHSLVSPQIGPGSTAPPLQAQQQQHLLVHAPSSSSSSGGALAQPIPPPTHAPTQLSAHIHAAGVYPGPPPLQQQPTLHPGLPLLQQQTLLHPGLPPLQQQPQHPHPGQPQPVAMGLHGHLLATSLPLHPPHALNVGGPSPNHPQQQQQMSHAHRHCDWTPHGYNSHGVALGSHSTPSPGWSGAGLPLRFEPGSLHGAPPLPTSPLLLDGLGTTTGGSGGGAPPPQSLQRMHSQHMLQAAPQTQGLTPLHVAVQTHSLMPPHIQQQSIQQPHLHPHAFPHSHVQQQQQQQQLPPPPPPLQSTQQPQTPAHHFQQHSHQQHSVQQQQPQQQQQQQGVQVPGGGVGGPPVITWQGGLAKSGMHMCTLQCTSGGANAASGATPGEREPVTWPPTLDVKLRVDLSYVVHSLYSHTAPHARAMRRLVTPGGLEQRSKLSEFLSYLADKNRAGVIKLEAAAGLPPRTLYLVPPSEQVCAALGTEWSAWEPFLLALVVPTAGGTTGGNRG